MNTYSFYDAGLAQAMWLFINSVSYEDWENENIDNDVSMAEYCLMHFPEFREFCNTRLGFDVYEPHA